MVGSIGSTVKLGSVGPIVRCTVVVGATVNPTMIV